MDSIKALLRLEFKARFGSINLKEAKSIIKLSAVLLFSILIYAVYIIGARSFLISFFIYDMEYIFLVLFISLAEIVLFFAGVSTIVKTLFFSGDNEMLLRFPVKGTEVFISKILYVFILQIVITITLFLPVFIIYGTITHQTFGFYFSLPFVLIFAILFPFLFANILAIPFMYLKSFLKDKYSLILIIFIAGVSGTFALYMSGVQGLLSFMSEQSMDFFSSQFMGILTGLTKYAVPFRQFANIMIGNNLFISILVALLTIGLSCLAAYLIVKKLYLITMFKNIEIEGSSFSRKKKDRVVNPFLSIINREFLEIFRSSNYSFQYLAMAFGAPVMVYFCNRLALFIGETNVGGGVLPALTMLVMFIFITIIVSFSATSISREGDNFYITKIVPVKYLTQISVKFTLYMLVAFLSILVSFGTLVLFKYLDPLRGLVMFASCFLYATALTCFSIKLDIIKPTFAMGGDGEITEGTPATFISLFIGLVLSVVVGVFGMVMSYFLAVEGTFYIILISTGVLAALAVFFLFFRLEKAYAKIMQR